MPFLDPYKDLRFINRSTPVDIHHPLTRGLVYYVNFAKYGLSAVNLSTGGTFRETLTMPSGQPVYGVWPRGPGYKFNGTNDYIRGAITPAVSPLSIMVHASQHLSGVLWSYMAADATHWDGWYSGGVSNFNSVNVDVFDGNPNAAGVIDPFRHAGIMVSTGVNNLRAQSGTKVVVDTTVTVPVHHVGFILALGTIYHNFGPGPDNWGNCVIHSAAIWNRALSIEEAGAISTNPYAFFQVPSPRRRTVIIPVPSIETTTEDYLKAQPSLSYPEDYLKIGATLAKSVELYAKFHAALQAESGSYLKLSPLLEKRVEPYVKFMVSFPESPQRYIRTAAAFAAEQNVYIRAAARFASHGDYLKARATLVRTPILTDVPDDGAEGQVGLMSRQYLSLVSVKKEIA